MNAQRCERCLFPFVGERCPKCGCRHEHDRPRPCVPLLELPSDSSRKSENEREPEHGSTLIIIEMC